MNALISTDIFWIYIKKFLRINVYLYIFSFRKIIEEFGTVKNIYSHTNINKTIKYNIKYKNNIFI